MNLLDRLNSFLTLAKCRSFTKAAEKLFCTQPTISHHIRHLEETLGAPLFYRSGKTVFLTKQGEIFYDYASKIQSLYNEAAEKIEHTVQFQPAITLYASHYIGTYLLPDIIKEVCKGIADIGRHLEVYTYTYIELLRNFSQEKCHCAFMPIYENDDYLQASFDCQVLFEEKFVLILPPSHPWKNRKTLYSRDLHSQTLLLPQSRIMQLYILSKLNDAGIQLRTMNISSFETIKESVKAGLGIAFLPVFSVKEELQNDKLMTRPVAGLQMIRRNGLVRRKGIKLTDSETEIYQKIAGLLKKVTTK